MADCMTFPRMSNSIRRTENRIGNNQQLILFKLHSIYSCNNRSRIVSGNIDSLRVTRYEMYYGFMHNLHLPFKCIKKLELLMILIHFDDAALDVRIACYSITQYVESD